MKKLAKSDNEKYQKLFSQYIKNGIKPEGLESLYTKVHEAIRKNPEPAPKKNVNYKNAKYANKPKKTHEQYLADVKAKMAAHAE